jgi:hypothetical protein
MQNWLIQNHQNGMLSLNGRKRKTRLWAGILSGNLKWRELLSLMLIQM